VSDIEFLREPVSSIDDIAPLWQRLERQGDNSFFVSWTWIGTWLECLPSHIRSELLIAVSDGKVIGLAILVPRDERRRSVIRACQLHVNATGEPALDCIMVEHNGFVGGGDGKAALWPAFVAWCAGESGADEFLLPGIREEGMEQFAGRAGLLHFARRVPGFVRDLPDTGEVLSQLSRNARQQLRRSRRASAALGELRLDVAASVGEALAWFGEMKTLHIAYWTRRGQQHAFHHSFFETFHRALIAQGTAEGSVQLRRMSAGDAVLGYLYDFRHDNRVYAYQSGLDDAYMHLRPGYVSHVFAIERSSAEGADSYDFLAGHNRLKQTFANRSYTLCWHRLARPTLSLRAEAALVRSVDAEGR